jgi:hypothetical protein
MAEVYIRNNDFVAVETFSVDTSAYGSGDLIADTQELSNVGIRRGQVVLLKSIHLLDKADQKVALYFVFLSAATSLGTENSAPTISDANSENVLAIVPIASTDYLDLGGTAFATKECSVSLELGSATTSLWVAIVNSTGTPTYAAADLIAKFGFLR